MEQQSGQQPPVLSNKLSGGGNRCIPDCRSILCPYRFMNPVSMFTGAAVIASVFIGSVWAGENKAIIKKFKKENPALFVFLVMVVSYFLMSLFGGVMVFLLGIKLPLLMIFAHASLRLRNMKNKLENKMESAGLKKSPMGIILEALGQQEENFSKIQDILESKLKNELCQ
ncbi:ADP-ribosylation factor-like 6 interacting protein 5a isoform X2 [Chanodichthys erythropterus]|uniref:ADP-ribosylation factor-like 6 interacting protein 5a isoform X2 n=1 Tax=Chanodichthys erythropterus TaxID=933992 RepID=UPI00351E2948